MQGSSQLAIAHHAALQDEEDAAPDRPAKGPHGALFCCSSSSSLLLLRSAGQRQLGASGNTKAAFSTCSQLPRAHAFPACKSRSEHNSRREWKSSAGPALVATLRPYTSLYIPPRQHNWHHARYREGLPHAASVIGVAQHCMAQCRQHACWSPLQSS